MKPLPPLTKRLFIAVILQAVAITITAANTLAVHSDSFQRKVTFKTIAPSRAIVTAVKSFKKRPANSAVFGDYIDVTIDHIDQFLNWQDSCCTEKAYNDSSIYLSLNGTVYTDLFSHDINRTAQTITFHLNRDSSKTLKRFAAHFLYPWDKLTVTNVSVCMKGKTILPTKVGKFTLYFSSPWLLGYTGILLFFILAVFIVLVRRTSIIRATDKVSPYSLSQSQLAFWTLLVSASILYIWLATCSLPELTTSTLMLLGISVVTTAAGKLIQGTQRTHHSKAVHSEGFWLDILSDEYSVTMHRFQMVLWTIILGFIFIQKVIACQQIPSFSDNYLVLTGISSGTYILLRYGENKSQQKLADTPVADTNDNSNKLS
jgi:hypothetical protein